MNARYDQRTGKEIHIFFDSIPSVNIRNTLKANGYRWDRHGQYWYGLPSLEISELLESLGLKDFAQKVAQHARDIAANDFDELAYSSQFGGY